MEFARIRLARIDTEGLDDASLLSAPELQRLKTMSHVNRRRQFIAGRALACKLIGALSGAGAMRALIDVSPTGKPFLVDQPDLHLSISHSSDWVACALASVPVGLDIERIDSKRSTRQLIEEVCSKEEQRLIASVAPARQDSLFLELWTLKEACIKRQGVALDVARMRAIEWTTTGLSDANCASWITADGLAVSVAGPPVHHFVSDLPSALGSVHCTLRRLADA